MHVHVFNFIRLAQILDHISLQYAPITNERKMQTKRTNASHERYEKYTKRTNYTENANKQTHDTGTNESLERSHILSNDQRSWFYRSTI